jgi:hypothetical protein
MTMRPWMRWMLAALAALALGAWWAPPLPVSAPLVSASRDEWRLPALPRRPDQTTLAALVNAAAFWGDAGQAKAASGPPADTRWRIAGVFGSGNERAVLVQFRDPARAAQRLKVGEALPTGHRIESIDATRVCIRIGKKTYWVGVERSDS